MLRVGIAQLLATANKAANIANAVSSIAQAAKEGAKIVALPVGAELSQSRQYFLCIQ